MLTRPIWPASFKQEANLADDDWRYTYCKSEFLARLGAITDGASEAPSHSPTSAQLSADRALSAVCDEIANDWLYYQKAGTNA